MRKHIASIWLAFFMFPLHAAGAPCETEAQLQEVRIRQCDGERFVGTAGEDGTLAHPIPFDAIPRGLEQFWSDLCQCYLWQVSGIAGAHTHVANFFRVDAKGRLALIPGGEFGSEIGKISRVSQRSGFIVEVRDSDVWGKRTTLERYRFDGKRFSKLK